MSILSALAGWGPAVFRSHYHWWLVPVLAPHVGALAGAWIYYVTVEISWPKEGSYDSVGTGSQPPTDSNYQQVLIKQI